MRLKIQNGRNGALLSPPRLLDLPCLMRTTASHSRSGWYAFPQAPDSRRPYRHHRICWVPRPRPPPSIPYPGVPGHAFHHRLARFAVLNIFGFDSKSLNILILLKLPLPHHVGSLPSGAIGKLGACPPSQSRVPPSLFLPTVATFILQ